MSAHVCQCTTDLSEILAEFPAGRRETLIPILQAVQGVFGFLPEEALGVIARHLGLSPAKVYGVATFYNQFRLLPVGKHTVRVCRGTACHVRGSKLLLDGFADQLGVSPGDTTADGEFTLETVACLGACSIAPVVTVDDNFHGAVQPRNIGKILKQYREE
ncbi:MAG TPA: NADH-quinone oxidoreductase subunit NuoE [Armatimonadota bacterium]|jgi:NADH-quinone oxidoreductase E subunit